MSADIPIGSITITYDLSDDGILATYVNCKGDLPMVTKLGLLDMARDTILRRIDNEGDDE